MTKRKYEKPPVCNPCWELHYCPYGTLVETMPLLRTAAEEKFFEKDYPTLRETPKKMYKRAKEELKETNFKDDDTLWNNMVFVMYTDPYRHEYFAQFDPKDLSCRVFGHVCPVFWHAEGATETREGRRTSRQVPREIMFKVARRDDYRCQVCGKQVPDDEIEFDHIIPHSKGGPTSVANIRLLCRRCNRKKRDSLNELLDLGELQVEPES